MTAVVVWHCRTCREMVGVYRPTGTNVLRAARHPQSAMVAGGAQCAGSFEPVDTGADVARDAERTARWRSFDAEVSAGPIVDNASTRLYYIGQLEGDVCPGCGDPIPGDVDECSDCRPDGAA